MYVYSHFHYRLGSISIIIYKLPGKYQLIYLTRQLARQKAVMRSPSSKGELVKRPPRKTFCEKGGSKKRLAMEAYPMDRDSVKSDLMEGDSGDTNLMKGESLL